MRGAILLGIGCAFALAWYAIAATAPVPSGTTGYFVVDSCGAENLTVGSTVAPRIDKTGDVCTSQ